jgi:hypothetical protein
MSAALEGSQATVASAVGGVLPEHGMKDNSSLLLKAIAAVDAARAYNSTCLQDLEVFFCYILR